jgi:fluoride exporter
MIWFMVAAGGAAGAVARYLTDLAARTRWPTGFPMGTFTVNVVGSLLLGVAVGLGEQTLITDDGLTVVGAGVLGSFTTFSTFGFETVRLLEEGRLRLAATSVGLTSLAAFAAAGVGLWIGSVV